MRADPHCWYCGCEVREYPEGDHAHYPDRATIDHVNSRSRQKPRPEQGRTILACAHCNSWRGQISLLLHQEFFPCQECGALSGSRFCCEECFWFNLSRLNKVILPWDQHREEKIKARKRAKRARQRQRRKQRDREKRWQA